MPVQKFPNQANRQKALTLLREQHRGLPELLSGLIAAVLDDDIGRVTVKIGALQDRRNALTDALELLIKECHDADPEAYRALHQPWRTIRQDAEIYSVGPVARNESAAAELGRLGGLKGGAAKTEAKAEAARANGAKGGRPPKRPGICPECKQEMKPGEVHTHWGK